MWAFCLAALARSTSSVRPTLWSLRKVAAAVLCFRSDLIPFSCIRASFADTTVKQIQACFKRFMRRQDIAIIIINQIYADMIRPTIDKHLLPTPSVLEIPSKQHAYDSSRDSILKRALVRMNLILYRLLDAV